MYLSPQIQAYNDVTYCRCTFVHKDFNYVLPLEDTFITAAALIKECTEIKRIGGETLWPVMNQC